MLLHDAMGWPACVVDAAQKGPSAPPGPSLHKPRARSHL